MKTYYVVDEVDEKPENILNMSPRHTDPLDALKELQKMQSSSEWSIYKYQCTDPVRIEVVLVPSEKGETQ